MLEPDYMQHRVDTVLTNALFYSGVTRTSKQVGQRKRKVSHLEIVNDIVSNVGLHTA